MSGQRFLCKRKDQQWASRRVHDVASTSLHMETELLTNLGDSRPRQVLREHVGGVLFPWDLLHGDPPLANEVLEPQQRHIDMPGLAEPRPLADPLASAAVSENLD